MNFITKTLRRLFASDADSVVSEHLYWEVVTVSRNPKLYQNFAIPDNLDGRFDCLMLHLFLVINQLQALSEHKVADNLLKFFIKDMDRSLRESGVGDPAISRKMRKVGEAYMGRMRAYGVALSDYDTLLITLHKNIYRNMDTPKQNIILLTDYVLYYKQVLNQFVPRKPLPTVALD